MWLFKSLRSPSELRGSNGYYNGGPHVSVKLSTLKPAAACLSGTWGTWWRKLIEDVVCYFVNWGGSCDFHSQDSRKLKVVHQYGPCSPRGHPAMNYHRDVLHNDLSRLETMHLRFAENSNGTTRGYISGLDVITLDYIAIVGYGTPKIDTTVYIDTSSDLSLLTCGETYCRTSGYSHHGEYFFPSSSSSFREISNLTNRIAEGFSDDGYYEMITAFEKGIAMWRGCTGFLSNDTLTLTPSIVLNDFMFGCGSRPGDRDLSDQIIGVMGLGRGRLSITSQGYRSINSSFSYCLSSLNGNTGFLIFGAHQEESALVQYTPMLHKSTSPSYYFVDLIGLSVGGKVLPIPASVFRDVGTVLDIGTVVTYLPDAAYLALRSEFDAWVRRYAVSVSGFANLDTCYDFEHLKEINIPKVAFLFAGGVTLELPPTGILYYIGSSAYCLAFSATGERGEFSVIGNVQQRSTEVIYDLGRGMVGFVPGSC
ncbi:unnamed protein product [Urochloa decumbens]|uniref:Peptidase A1 domain-containing protein n=1 Tax=Urochloa decumbens TaxID=240449 RepID=A0ABC9DX30_9POAL